MKHTVSKVYYHKFDLHRTTWVNSFAFNFRDELTSVRFNPFQLITRQSLEGKINKTGINLTESLDWDTLRVLARGKNFQALTNFTSKFYTF